MWNFAKFVLRLMLLLFLLIIGVMAMTPEDDVNGARSVLVTKVIMLRNMSPMLEAIEVAGGLDSAFTTGIFTVEKKALTRCARIAISQKLMNESQALDAINNCVATLPKVDPHTGLPK